MRKSTLLGLITSATLLAGCSTAQPVGQQMNNLHLNTINTDRNANMVFSRVPDAGNPISNAMMLTLLASGSRTNAVEGISEVLTARPKPPLGIIGDNTDVNVATLKLALKDLPDSPQAREYHVYIDASPEQIAALQKIANSKNIKVYGTKNASH